MVVNALNASELGLFLLERQIDNSGPATAPLREQTERIETILNQTLKELGPAASKPRPLLLANLGGLHYLRALREIKSEPRPDLKVDLKSFLGTPSPALEALLASEGYYSQARSYAEELKYWPAVGWASFNLGVVHQLLGRFDAARSDLSAALKIGSRYYLSSLVWESEQALALVEWDQNSPADSIEARELSDRAEENSGTTLPVAED